MDKKLDISRRKVLGGLGTIGAAGALGGAATTSLLWDEEVFGDGTNPNVLQAGKLDLKVDWEEHYVDWIGAETEIDGVRRIGPDGRLESDEVGLPTPDNPQIGVKNMDTDGNGVPQIDDFMAATITETSDEFDGPDDIDAEEEDAPHDLVDQPPAIVTINDVKPGDFGEVTFSYHLFGNPGWVSFCTEEIADADNGITEPEDKVNGHTPDQLDGTAGGDLGEYVQACLWYDPNCDNRLTGGASEVMISTDLSESMDNPFPGTPNVDDNTGDGETKLEAVKAAIGDFGEDRDFLSELADSCEDLVSVGSVGTSFNLNHLDDRSDGSDGEEGNDAPGAEAAIDKFLTSPSDAELKSLFADGNDITDFEIDDPDLTDFWAERPYLEDGGTTTPQGIDKSHKALIPDGESGPSSVVGVDTSGNASSLGDANKVIIVLTDGKPGESTADAAEQNASEAGEDGITVLPIIVNENPVGDDVSYAEALSTDNVDPVFAVKFDGAVSGGECPSSVTDAGFTCTSLTTALAEVRNSLCALGGERKIAGPAPIKDLITDLDECLLLDPIPAGSAVAADDFDGTACHAPSSTGCLALAWWLPRDIPGVNDNIIQSDRYEFLVEFNAVQCRHNVTSDGEPIAQLPGDADAEAAD